MKFSDVLEEYLQLRDDERDANSDSEPISRGSNRRERMRELLEEMDQLTAGVDVSGEGKE